VAGARQVEEAALGGGQALVAAVDRVQRAAARPGRHVEHNEVAGRELGVGRAGEAATAHDLQEAPKLVDVGLVHTPEFILTPTSLSWTSTTRRGRLGSESGGRNVTWPGWRDTHPG
jgi:hypothetical protein